MTAIFLTAAFTLVLYMMAVFLLALRLKDNSIVDIAYGPAFIAAASSAVLVHGASHPRFLLLRYSMSHYQHYNDSIRLHYQGPHHLLWQ